jgi:hypothetical protein
MELGVCTLFPFVPISDYTFANQRLPLVPMSDLPFARFGQWCYLDQSATTAWTIRPSWTIADLPLGRWAGLPIGRWAGLPIGRIGDYLLDNESTGERGWEHMLQIPRERFLPILPIVL